MEEFPWLPLIAIIFGGIVAWGIVAFYLNPLKETEPLMFYSPWELMARAMYCMNEFCPEHGYQYGTFGTVDGKEVCFCGNETEDGGAWTVWEHFFLND